MHKFLIAIVAALVPVAAGCTSFGTTHIHRSESNMNWEKKRALHGIPVTLKVPTHLKVDVLEKHILLLNSDNTVERRPAPIALRRVDTSFIETEKVFLVDIKRPAAGTLDTTVDLDPDAQYFKKIEEKLTDETIQDVGNLIAAIAPGGLFGTPTSGQDDGAATQLSAGIKEITNVVASQIFEVDAPDFEMRLMAFLNRHVNCCHDCGLVPSDFVPPYSPPAIVANEAPSGYLNEVSAGNVNEASSGYLNEANDFQALIRGSDPGDPAARLHTTPLPATH